MMFSEKIRKAFVVSTPSERYVSVQVLGTINNTGYTQCGIEVLAGWYIAACQDNLLPFTIRAGNDRVSCSWLITNSVGMRKARFRSQYESH